MSETTKALDAPERIFLNLCDETDCTETFAEHHDYDDGVTWTADTPALLHAVGYVRSDQHDALCARVRELEAALGGFIEAFDDEVYEPTAPIIAAYNAARAALAPSSDAEATR